MTNKSKKVNITDVRRLTLLYVMSDGSTERILISSKKAINTYLNRQYKVNSLEGVCSEEHFVVPNLHDNVENLSLIEMPWEKGSYYSFCNFETRNELHNPVSNYAENVLGYYNVLFLKNVDNCLVEYSADIDFTLLDSEYNPLLCKNTSVSIGAKFRKMVCDFLGMMNVDIVSHCAGKDRGQQKMSFGFYKNPLDLCQDIMLLKEVVFYCGEAFRVIPTFAPKISSSESGNNLKVRMKCASKEHASNCVSYILSGIEDILVFSNPDPISQKRFYDSDFPKKTGEHQDIIKISGNELHFGFVDAIASPYYVLSAIQKAVIDEYKNESTDSFLFFKHFFRLEYMINAYSDLMPGDIDYNVFEYAIDVFKKKNKVYFTDLSDKMITYLVENY